VWRVSRWSQAHGGRPAEAQGKNWGVLVPDDQEDGLTRRRYIRRPRRADGPRPFVARLLRYHVPRPRRLGHPGTSLPSSPTGMRRRRLSFHLFVAENCPWCWWSANP
jgi:hypothetical protein